MSATRSRLADARRAPTTLLITPALIAVAVLVTQCEVVVPRHGWNEKWGPMVPHETFPGDCGICHVTEGWEVLRADFAFDHEAETGHALEGAHRAAACLRCHNDRGPIGVYVARGCGGCHVDPHKSTLGLDCERCHDQDTWRPAPLVDDHARTSFPLYGQHLLEACEACHPRAPVGDFRGAPTSCEICHQADVARATQPDHTANGLVTGCERCHTPTGWAGAAFTHDSFPLIGGHGGLQCSQCHGSGPPTSVSPLCYSCHQQDYQRAEDHVADGYPTDCTRCHSIVAWDP